MIWKFESAKPNSEMSVLRPFLSRLNKRTTIFHGLYSCTLIDHRNDVQMFKTQVEPRAADEWFHCNVLNILTSFLWSISVQTIENCCRLFFYNNSHSFLSLCFGLIDDVKDLLFHHLLLIARHYIYTCRLGNKLPKLQVYRNWKAYCIPQ